jgi:ferrous iron transport protein B
MLADYAGILCPAVLLLNLMDVAEEQGKIIEAEKLREKLGIPVIPFVAADLSKYDLFYNVVDTALEEKRLLNIATLTEKYSLMENGVYDKILALLPDNGIENYSSFWLAAKLIENDSEVLKKIKKILSPEEFQELEGLLSSVENGALETAGYKFQWIDELLRDTLVQNGHKPILTKFDRIATHRRWSLHLFPLLLL